MSLADKPLDSKCKGAVGLTWTFRPVGAELTFSECSLPARHC